MPETCHPNPEELASFATGSLPLERAASIEEHIDQCEACCQLLQELSANDTSFVAKVQDAIHAPRLSNYWSESDEVESKSDVEKAPKNVGAYRLLQKIGTGGMGDVWMAEQRQPVLRRVAIKLTQVGTNSKEVIARFEAERQALAMMDHPNIAKVFDAGTTESGSPYFVMELVKGIPLVEYCDLQKLGITERLKLFVSVCNAVQHAHQKGIIHRDLKPSNVLVALYDGEPVPKVIDFGLAKALDSSIKLSDKTIFTEFGKIVGTLNYMSPEQAELNSLDVDTRTDVYSLGVMLYELLTGFTPLDKDTIQNTALLAILEMIRESDPPRPSNRLSDRESAKVVSEQRNLAPELLCKKLHGELDWVVMKALDKNRNRRYESASRFAEDIQRYLNDEPVTAKPGSTSYKAWKFVRKHRGFVASATTAVGLLIAGIVASSYFAFQANRSATEASQTAERYKSVLKIVAQSFRSANPEDGAAPNMLAKDVLKNAMDSLKTNELDFDGKATLLDSIGKSFAGIGDFDSSISVQKEVLELSIKELGTEHESSLLKMNNLAVSYTRSGQTQKAIDILEEIIPKLTSTLGEEDISTIGAIQNLSACYIVQERIDEAIPLAENNLTLLTRIHGPDHRSTLHAMNNLANCYSQSNRIKESLELRKKTYNLMTQKFGPTHSDTLNGLNNLAIGYHKDGQKQKSINLQNDVVEKMTRHLGSDHPKTLKAIDMLALMYDGDGMHAEALELAKRSLERKQKKFGLTHQFTKDSEQIINMLLRQPRTSGQRNLNNEVWDKVADPSETAPLNDEQLAQMRELCELNPNGNYLNTLGVAEYRMGNFAEAIAAAEKSLAKSGRLPSSPVDLAILTMSHLKLGDLESVANYRKKMLEAIEHKSFENDTESRKFVAEAESHLSKISLTDDSP